MALIKTTAGFEAEVNSDGLDDIEFLEALSDMRDGDALVIPRLAKMLIGEAGYTRLKEFYKDPATGKTSTTSVSSALGELMQGLSEDKKKS